MPQNEPSDESIFALALEKLSPAERAAFVEGACVGNPTLRERVEGLLRSHEEAGSFLQRPVDSLTVTFDHDRLSEGPGTKIGPYKLLQQIGEGGMGVVYMAEQEQPVRRKVALKIIKPGMDSKQVIARFEAERQALAMMDHTNIARVFEAGTTESGRPYFVMELVHGVPITHYCDSNQLTPRERLELFVPVCQAIQHAHQKGIIHRDIKPSNVLVTMYDDRPVPKVIDFGVAKATEQRLTERTLFTQYGALVGTFEYMSPEQAEMNAFGVDTRSDIYSLGVLLYELLTGSTPIERIRLREAALGELIRLIKEEEPPRPSVRLSSSGDLPKLAALRKMEPARLSKVVRGEVDWIVMKCLEKDRTRRYETANAVARDVERHLKDESVEACPPSAGYRLRKFTRKNRTSMAIAACFAILLLAGVVASTWQAARAMREQRMAFAAEMHAAMARREAEDRQVEAETARRSLRRSLYASDMQLAEEAWESGDILRMHALLDGQKPGAGEDDLRGFEWHYLRRLGSGVRMTALAHGTYWGKLSPDGTHYVCMGKNVAPRGPEVNSETELRLLDVASGRQLRRIVPLPGRSYTHSLAFSPDGKRFSFASLVGDESGREDWKIQVFDWETGREVCTLADADAMPRPVAFDPSGNRLAVVHSRSRGLAGCELKIWRLDDGKELCAIPLPDRQIVHRNSVVFSPDGARLAALTIQAGPGEALNSGGEVRVWEAGTGRELLRFVTRSGSCGLAYSPDGRRLAEIDAGASHRLRDAVSGKEVLELTRDQGDGSAIAFAFSPDGSRLAVSSRDNKVRIWDVTERRAGGGRAPESILEGKTNILTQVVWSAGGRRVLAAVDGGTVVTWQVATRKSYVVVEGSDHFKAVAATVSAASPQFAAAFEDTDGMVVVKVWDEGGNVRFTSTSPSTGPHASSQGFRKVELSRDGTRLACFGSDSNRVDGEQVDREQKEVGRLRVWDVGGSQEVFRRDCPGRVFHDAAFSPDGYRLATASGASRGPRPEQTDWISVWDLETGRERLHLDVPFANSLAFSPDGRRLAGRVYDAPGGEEMGEVRIWDAATGGVVLTRKFVHGRVGTMAYNADGTSLAVAVDAMGEAGVIKVLDADTGRERLSLAGHRNMIWKLAISPDGRRLASLGSFPMQAPEIVLWDLSGGREMLTLQATGIDLTGSNVLEHSGFGFSPDGQRLIYIPGGSRRDAEVQVWDATPLSENRVDPLAVP
jgi:eukaryotic-like serine/threonine-protein kinase